jgi:hypothetical protein
MAFVVTITGVAGVTDDATGKPLADPKRVAKLARLRHTEDTIAEYFDPDLEDLGITGGDVRLALDPSGKKFLVVSTFKAPRRLTKPEVARLVEETTGQWSDGIGEGCFDDAARKYQVTIDLWQRGRKPKVEQVDDGKPAKAKQPPSAAAQRVAALVQAADAGDLDKVKELLAAGVPPDGRDKHGVTALYCAAAEGHLAVVEALLAAGADVNARMGKGPCNGTTALAGAAKHADEVRDKNVAVAKRLLAAGADPNIVSTEPDTKSALSWAVLRYATPLVKLLLAAGADPNLRDAEPDMFIEPPGMTPLMHVTDPETAKLLLDAGADPTLRSEHASWPTAAQYIRETWGAYGPRTSFGRSTRAAADLIERYQRRLSRRGRSGRSVRRR